MKEDVGGKMAIKVCYECDAVLTCMAGLSQSNVAATKPFVSTLCRVSPNDWTVALRPQFRSVYKDDTDS